MLSTNKIEYHVVDNCNLSCNFCSHYSNFHRPKAIVDIEAAKTEWLYWSRYITPKRFSLIGGEPTLHPNLTELAIAAKEIWNKSSIWLFSNGTYLHRHPELHKHIDNLIISSHYEDMSDISKEVKRFKSSQIRGTTKWLQYYKIVDGKKVPYTDNNQRQSWKVCVAKECIVLRHNALWKCPQLAFHRDVGIDWEKFNNYKPLTNPELLEEWLSREDEECCSCCPAKQIYHIKPLVKWNANT